MSGNTANDEYKKRHTYTYHTKIRTYNVKNNQTPEDFKNM
jgi:hypothetical protein